MILNLPYLIPRVMRHFLPEKFVRTLLLHSIIIKPGIETSNPLEAVERYVQVLKERDTTFNGKRVMVFGYGGRFDIGLGLLQAGAEHVILCDKFAPPDEPHNQQYFSKETNYFVSANGKLRPRSEKITLLEADIRDKQITKPIEPVDIIVSSSVYEHVDDVIGITKALSVLTKPDGIHIHYVDLRDHFFKYPFEMLRFSEQTWRTWLNPSSNHNRFRLWDYRKAFEACFGSVAIEVLVREPEAFQRLRPYIRSEFLSPNEQENDVSLICVIATDPIKK